MARIWVQGTILTWNYREGDRPPRGAPYRVIAQTKDSLTILTTRPTQAEARSVAKAVRAALKAQ